MSALESGMRQVVEVGDWEHECCGDAYERDTVVTLTCLVVTAADGSVRRVETHHDAVSSRWPIEELHGRVGEIQLRHADGRLEPIERLPSGRALRGVDEHDDGALHRAWTREPVTYDSATFLLTLET